MKYRKLRIAWSVAWGIACLLLIALWVRSYQTYDLLYKNVPGGNVTKIVSYFGRLCLYRGEVQFAVPRTAGWTYQHGAATELVKVEFLPNWNFRRAAVIFPHWFSVLLAAAVAAIPWIRWRFSIRTLLTVTTVAAIGLAWLVYWFK